MQNERGVAMPAVLLFTFLFLALFLHQANLLLLEKQFYFEAEQFALLENVMDNTVVALQRDIKTQGISSIYTYEEGTAHISYTTYEPNQLQIFIRCISNEGRMYKASFLYDEDYGYITEWNEER